MSDLFPIILGSGVVAALIEFGKVIFCKIFDRIAKKHDKQENKESEISVTVNLLKDALRQSLKSNIRQLCRKYIDDGSIDFDERGDLIDMHEIYHKLGGNGHLDADIRTINSLPIRNNKH